MYSFLNLMLKDNVKMCVKESLAEIYHVVTDITDFSGISLPVDRSILIFLIVLLITKLKS